MWLFDLLPPSGSCGKKPSWSQILVGGPEVSRQIECDVMRDNRTAVLSAVMSPPRLGPDEVQAEQVLVDQHRNELSQAVLQCLHVSPNAVIVHLYDLTEEFVKPNAVIALQAGAGGAFHCGVEVYGGEWSYGESGIHCDAPRSQTWHVYKCSIMLGSIDLGPTQVSEILQDLVDTWSGSDYDVLRCNCCSFAQELCDRLGVGPMPPWIDRFARIGSAVSLGGWMFPGWQSSPEVHSDGSSFHSRHVAVEGVVEDSRDDFSLPMRFQGLLQHDGVDMMPHSSRRHSMQLLGSHEQREAWQRRSQTPPARLVSEQLRHTRGSSMKAAVPNYPPPLPGRLGGSVASTASNRSHTSAAPLIPSNLRRVESCTPKKPAAVGGSVASVGSASSSDPNLIRSSSNQIHMAAVHCNSFPLIRGSKIVPTPARTLNLSKDPTAGMRRPSMENKDPTAGMRRPSMENKDATQGMRRASMEH